MELLGVHLDDLLDAAGVGRLGGGHDGGVTVHGAGYIDVRA